MRNEYCIEWVERTQNSVSVRSIFHVIIINVTNQVANEPNIHKDLKKCHCNGMNQSCSKQQHIKMETGKYRIKGVKMTRNSLKSREANGFRGTNRSEYWRRERKKKRNESIQELLLWFLLSSHFLSFSSNENVCYIWCLCVCICSQFRFSIGIYIRKTPFTSISLQTMFIEVNSIYWRWEKSAKIPNVWNEKKHCNKMERKPNGNKARASEREVKKPNGLQCQ